MATLVTVVGVVLGGLCALIAQSSNSGPRLERGLAQLGKMWGCTEMDFVNAFGAKPTTISTLAHGQRLLQWQTGGQHLAVLFTPDNRFLQITHRYGV